MDSPTAFVSVRSIRATIHPLLCLGLLLLTSCVSLDDAEQAALRPLQKPMLSRQGTIFERVEDYGMFAETNPHATASLNLLPTDHPVKQAANPIRETEVPLVENDEEEPVYPIEKGIASHYSYRDGRMLATGERYKRAALTAAHKKLPFGTVVRCTRTDTGESVVVTINDRGPYVKGRIIDLSHAAAKEIGLLKDGIAPCKIEVLAFPLIETMGPKGNG